MVSVKLLENQCKESKYRLLFCIMNLANVMGSECLEKIKENVLGKTNTECFEKI